MSTHAITVVPVALEPHPNADTLSIVHVWGYTCCVRSADFAGVDRGAYVPPDSLVDPTRPEFAFLAPKAKAYNGRPMARIRVARLRGMLSQGLLVRGHPEWALGQDVAAELGVEHYDPPIQMWGPQAATDAAPPHESLRDAPKYDVENWRRYPRQLVPGEMVLVTEKIHGANARYAWRDGQIFAGSRTGWKREDPRSPWWIALQRHPEILEWCAEHPDLVCYGEIYGLVQDLRYGATPEDPVRFAAFDLLRGNAWVPPGEARTVGRALPWVPELYCGPYDPDRCVALAEGESGVAGAGHLREGVVVKPLLERTDGVLGRVQLKIVSNAYLER